MFEIFSTEPDRTIHEYLDFFIAQSNLLIMIGGAFANLICIIVLSQKRILIKRYNVYLLAIALADFCFCVIVTINYWIVLTKPASAIYDLNVFTCYLTDFVIANIDSFCILLTLVLSVDRLNSIKSPLTSRLSYTQKYPTTICLIVLFFLLVVRVPEATFGTKTYVYPSVNDTNITAHCSIGGPSDESQPVKFGTGLLYILFASFLLPLALNVIPAFFALSLNFDLWVHIRRYMRILGSEDFGLMAHQPQQALVQQRLYAQARYSQYFVIIIPSIWLVVSILPYYSILLFHWIVKQNPDLLGDHFRLLQSIQAFSSVFFNSNHVINLAIYLLFHRSFRLNFFRPFQNLSNRIWCFTLKIECNRRPIPR
nr:G protein-coupled receptor [Proales similis]